MESSLGGMPRGRRMARQGVCWRFLVMIGIVFFFIYQIRMSGKHSVYVAKMTTAMEAEQRCVERLHKLLENLNVLQSRNEELERKIMAMDEVRNSREFTTKNEIGKTEFPTTNDPIYPASILERHQQITQGDSATEVMAGGGGGGARAAGEEAGGKDEHAREAMVDGPIAAVVIMACNRADYLERTIKSVLTHHQSSVKVKFPLYISQDGVNEEVKRLATSFDDHKISYLQHIEAGPPAMVNRRENVAYYRIANHYKFALGQLFDIKKYSKVIILEDDMEISPDFFSYFEATSALLDLDDSILAISSWNDNGLERLVSDSEALYRSDFFPGLGWMMNSQLWNELKPKWPAAYWDDWLRLPETRKGRQSIRPEICRTYNFGEVGSSYGQYFAKHLAAIKLNDRIVDWSRKDLSFLLKANYPKHFAAMLDAAIPTALMYMSEQEERDPDHDIRVMYADQRSYELIARRFGLFEEWKEGMPRGSYEGVVVFRQKGKGGRNVFLISPSSRENIRANIRALGQTAHR